MKPKSLTPDTSELVEELYSLDDWAGDEDCVAVPHYRSRLAQIEIDADSLLDQIRELRELHDTIKREIADEERQNRMAESLTNHLGRTGIIYF